MGEAELRELLRHMQDVLVYYRGLKNYLCHSWGVPYYNCSIVGPQNPVLIIEGP